MLFEGFEQGAEAVRALAQSGLHPANCRLLDPGEAALTGAAPDGTRCWCWASSRPTIRSTPGWRGRSSCARDHGGRLRERAAACGERGASEGAWRDAFLQAPYLRDTLVAGGRAQRDVRDGDHLGPASTTSCAAVRAARASGAICGGQVTCRFTHVYPDGAAPYFTVLAPARRGAELEQWAEVKAAASEAILAAGGTITHHHAVGRDHRPWYDRQRPEPFAEALRAAKAGARPRGDPQPRRAGGPGGA